MTGTQPTGTSSTGSQQDLNVGQQVVQAQPPGLDEVAADRAADADPQAEPSESTVPGSNADRPAPEDAAQDVGAPESQAGADAGQTQSGGVQPGGQGAVATDDSAVGTTSAAQADPAPTADQGVAHTEEPLTEKLAEVQDSIDTAKESAHKALTDPQ